MVTTKARGDEAEEQAARWLARRGLSIVARNWRVARGPGAPGGEIDLIVQEPDGTIAFVEVRARADARHGGAAASVSPAKRRRIVHAARCWLAGRAGPWPPCRFDVVAIDGQAVQWLRGAFDADGR